MVKLIIWEGSWKVILEHCSIINPNVILYFMCGGRDFSYEEDLSVSSVSSVSRKKMRVKVVVSIVVFLWNMEWTR
jgi:hypothetical protein